MTLRESYLTLASRVTATDNLRLEDFSARKLNPELHPGIGSGDAEARGESVLHCGTEMESRRGLTAPADS